MTVMEIVCGRRCAAQTRPAFLEALTERCCWTGSCMHGATDDADAILRIAATAHAATTDGRSEVEEASDGAAANGGRAVVVILRPALARGDALRAQWDRQDAAAATRAGMTGRIVNGLRDAQVDGLFAVDVDVDALAAVLVGTFHHALAA